MTTSSITEYELLEQLIQRLHITPQKNVFDDRGYLIELEIFGFDLPELPAEIYQFTHLKYLNASCNRITSLSPQFGQLKRLKTLYLNHNRLQALPAEIGQLTRLDKLILNSNCLTSIPSEIEQLANSLRVLILGNIGVSFMPREIKDDEEKWKTYVECTNVIPQLPAGIWNLKKLQRLELWYLGLTDLAPAVAQLTMLRELSIGRNPFPILPDEIGQLTTLQELRVHFSALTVLPATLGQLQNLRILSIGGDQLSTLPNALWQLQQLTSLWITWSPAIALLPAEVAQLTHLEQLRMSNTRITTLPAEIGQLTRLKELRLKWNQLRTLPPELGKLTQLEIIDVSDNKDLLTPPPEVVARGTDEILTFLRELQHDSIARYEAKLLIVGEGGTGKSSLLRALRKEDFIIDTASTHGIEIGRLELATHDMSQPVTLNSWDFGGQHIYHATHQFFLTQRSVYVIVWNARLGVEQGRLSYWLDTINALAPDVPVLIVATHTDERAPDLNYQLLKDTYPQVIAHISVSNKTGEGVQELQTTLALQALKLPQMGQRWPRKWLAVEQALQGHTEHQIDANTYIRYCAEQQVEESVANGTLGDYLHDLGKVLYFRDDYILYNLVILKPNWITRAISYVLTDEATRQANGILRHSELPRIWATDEAGHPYAPHLYPIFLRLMERFDLSYQIEADKPGAYATSSLIPQLLPFQPPTHLPVWSRTPAPDETQVEMIYRFDFVPSGIMSWFIVRTHRYSQNLHWREGVALAYEGHQARVELNPMLRELRIIVRGIQPYNFFTILKNTLDIILARFQGLQLRREIPCICHWNNPYASPCRHLYNYEELTRRMHKKRYKVECAHSFEEISVPKLLYGIHTSTDQEVMADIKRGQQQIVHRLEYLQQEDQLILETLRQQSELIARNFTRQWNLEMQRIEAECPNTFFLTLGANHRWNPKNWISQEYRLYLVCQHPSRPHAVGEGYTLRASEEWWQKISPWLNHLINFLKFGIPLGVAAGAIYNTINIESLQAHIDLMEQITYSIPEIVGEHILDDVISQTQEHHEGQAEGSALRALYGFLKTVDSDRSWGGLNKTITSDGNILWLCGEHRKQYDVKPLIL
ncbi:COR domain-containing protein [Dictyobacter arantiisoli]|uniref:non-specific serine/threonine protein kinase n=1 Tax=Dictyobacter arantiisoli TaxID=2014874 RepID=A0A5A5TIJ8_9CHLR|nr:COR domain-containing protein [Dictyobacter arantiisoli]GCF11028.1 hypothetical protein KDI_45920 [Dictyobacter arantiisoli]